MDALGQVKKLIDRSQNVLVVPARESMGDGLSSALALLFTLRKLGKNANILTDEFPEKLQFLADLEPNNSRDFVISINGSEKEIGEMRYEKNEKGLKIYLTLNRGEINKGDFSFSSLSRNPDLLIALGIKDSKDLNAYRAPILNIGNQAGESFGEVNLIETTNSLAEISTSLIKTIGLDLISENVATCLLAGIICASQNFLNPKTKPKTFETAAYLINRGANHQKIIQHLYRQKHIAEIRLLGRILEKLDFNKEKGLYSASLTEQDFKECSARPKDLGLIVEELKFNFRYLSNLLILWQSHASPAVIKGLFYSIKPDLVEKITKGCEGVSKGEGVLFLIKGNNLTLAKEKVLAII